MSFDFGEKLYERPRSFKLWPTDGTFTALVDADLLPYIVGYTTEESRYAKALLRVEEGEYDCVEDTPECEDAIDQLDWTVNHWVTQSGADSALLYLTDAPGNFRIAVAFTQEYKGQRIKDKPPFFFELKKHLEEKHNAIVARNEEADDLIVTELHRRHAELVEMGAELGSPEHKKFSDVVAVSIDKDIPTAPGWHHNPNTGKTVWVDVLGWIEAVYKIKDVTNYRFVPLCVYHDHREEDCITYAGESPCCPDVYKKGKNQGEVKTKRIKDGLRKSQYVDKIRGGGLKFFYAQLLMGDGADNIPGVPGVGMTRAFEVVNPCTTEEELYARVLQVYRERYGESFVASNYRGGSLRLTAEQMLIEQGRLLHMQTREGEVWRAEVYCPSGEDEVWRS